MASSNQWNTSVDQLCAVFHRALVALVPVMDEVKIPWRDESAYDDWDNIASALYKNVVESSICHAYRSEALRLPAYGILFPDYSIFDYIAVFREANITHKLAFVSFSTGIEPFDSVRVMELSETGIPTRESPLRVPYSEVEFKLRVRGPSSALISELAIDL